MSGNKPLNIGKINIIKTDTSYNNQNLLLITGNPNAKIDCSTNEVHIRKNITIDGSINNTQITNITNKIDALTLSGNFITREELDASLSSLTISEDIINRQDFDLSFNDLQNKSDNFFFFFKLKPWSLVYKDGNYNYPISNYGNNFSYNLGNYNSSFIDNFSSTTKNLQLLWKIPPRILLDSTLAINNIDYLPIYNNLIIEFKEQNENIWRELLNINNFPDPSNNSNFPNYNNKNDENMIFNLNLTRNTSQTIDTNNINIIDNSFNIDYFGGLNNFKNSKAYQFRIFLSNISNLENTFDYKVDSYGYDTSNIYLYFPDNSGTYFLTAARGSPKSPTNLTFININYNNTTINGSLIDSTADTNNIISLPLESNNDNDNKLVFVLSLLANKNNNYKKYIGYLGNSYNLHDISNLSNPSANGQFSIFQSNNIEPEFTYDLSNYGMSFANNLSNITYANNILLYSDIVNNFTTPPPLRNQVNPSYNNFINNYNLFDTSLTNYNSNLEYKTIKWRENNQSYNLYFFNDNNSVFSINENNLNYKLFNSLKTININEGINIINNINEPKGIDFIDNSLCSFIMYSQKIKESNISNIYNPFDFDTSFNNFIRNHISENNNNFSLNYISEDICSNGANTIADYSKTNGYYVGLVLNDINYNIDFNDFFNISTDLCFNNIQLKTKITQQFDNASYNNEKTYKIYKITDDLSQNITLDYTNSSFTLTYDVSNQGTYFGLTSIKPHNSKLDISFNGLLNNLSKYIRPTNDLLATLNLIISGSVSYSNSKNINWESNSNNETQNINHSYTFYPLNNLDTTYGTYEGNYNLNGIADLTIYNNVFSESNTINPNNISLGNTINISNKYFWDITNSNLHSSSSYKIKNTNMIVFNSNPLTNFSDSGSSYNSSDFIKYNQAMFLNNEFYGDSSMIPYINYSNYYSNSNKDYSILSNSGDSLGSLTTINSSYSWNSYEINFSNISNKIIKWVCIKLDSSNITVRNNGLILHPVPNGDPSNVSSYDIFYFIKTNLSNDWFNCQQKSNTSYASQTSGGIFHLGSNADGSIMKVVIPNIATIDNLHILIGINETSKLQLSQFDYNFW